MDGSALLSLLAIVITSIFLLAGSAAVAWRLASRSTPKRKPSPSLEQIQSFDAALAQLQADQASLFSTLEKLTTTVKRLSSRNGMRELREREETPAAPPVGTDKATLFRHYGMSGKVGPAFAQAQMDLEQRSKIQ